MNIRVSISGPVMGDLTISRGEQDSGRCVTDGPDRDAEDCARMLEQIATDIRRMFPKPTAPMTIAVSAPSSTPVEALKFFEDQIARLKNTRTV